MKKNKKFSLTQKIFLIKESEIKAVNSVKFFIKYSEKTVLQMLI